MSCAITTTKIFQTNTKNKVNLVIIYTYRSLFCCYLTYQAIFTLFRINLNYLQIT